jgi:hypothetical protein
MEGISGFGSTAARDFGEATNIAPSKAIRPQPSLSGIIEAASYVEKSSFARLEAMEQIAPRLTALATRVAGSYPSSAPATGGPQERASDRAGPGSVIDAAMQRVTDIHAPLNRMDSPLREIVQAIEVLEAALS